MSPLYLYPAITKKLGGGGGGKLPLVGTDGISVFRNGERIKTPFEPNNEERIFWNCFCSPSYRIPAMVITDTGRIIVGADYRSCPKDQTAIAAAYAYSDDNGKTWNKGFYNANGGYDENKYCRIMDQTMFYYKGRIHVICGRWNGSTNNGNWTQYPNDSTWGITHYYSDDDGNTWNVDWNWNRTNVSGFEDGHSWLGGVGNAVVTKFGTCVVPIQVSTARGTVSAGFIWSNDGINWTRSTNVLSGVSESSIAQWVDGSGRVEIILVGRKDPNSAQNKYVGYVYQTDANTFGQTWNPYPIFDGKIPARNASSGCQGSALLPCNETGNLCRKMNLFVSYPNNYLSAHSPWIRDHIVVGGFSQWDVLDGNSRKLKEYECVNPLPGAYYDGVPYGGYSIMYYNHKVKKFGIAYESELGIKYKDLSHLIPTLLYESAK